MVANKNENITDEILQEIKKLLISGPVCPYKVKLRENCGWMSLKTTCHYRKILALELQRIEGEIELKKYEEEYPDG